MGWPDLRAACDLSWPITEFAGLGLVGGQVAASSPSPALPRAPGLAGAGCSWLLWMALPPCGFLGPPALPGRPVHCASRASALARCSPSSSHRSEPALQSVSLEKNALPFPQTPPCQASLLAQAGSSVARSHRRRSLPCASTTGWGTGRPSGFLLYRGTE